MNCHKTAFNQVTGIAVFVFVLLFSSADSFAQNTTLTFNNLIAISGNDDTTLKRPRIVSEVKTIKPEPVLPVAAGNIGSAVQLERRAFDVLNGKRAEKGLPPLVWSEDMARVARAHSQEMAQFKFFSHAGRNGSMVDDRAESFGFKKWRAIGENIAYNRGYENPAEFACERWMQSVSHRDNILNSRWQEAGVGVAIAADGTYYFTEVFIVPR